MTNQGTYSSTAALSLLLHPAFQQQVRWTIFDLFPDKKKRIEKDNKVIEVVCYREEQEPSFSRNVQVNTVMLLLSRSRMQIRFRALKRYAHAHTERYIGSLCAVCARPRIRGGFAQAFHVELLRSRSRFFAPKAPAQFPLDGYASGAYDKEGRPSATGPKSAVEIAATELLHLLKGAFQRNQTMAVVDFPQYLLLLLRVFSYLYIIQYLQVFWCINSVYGRYEEAPRPTIVIALRFFLGKLHLSLRGINREDD